MKAPRYKIASWLVDQGQQTHFSQARLSQAVAAYLLENGRTGELSSLMRDVMQLRAEQGTVEVTAVSAHELTPAGRTAIRSQIDRLYPRAKQVIINEVRDPEVLGGLRLEMANQQLDLTLRGQLNRFKQLTTVRN